MKLFNGPARAASPLASERRMAQSTVRCAICAVRHLCGVLSPRDAGKTKKRAVAVAVGSHASKKMSSMVNKVGSAVGIIALGTQSHLLNAPPFTLCIQLYASLFPTIQQWARFGI